MPSRALLLQSDMEVYEHATLLRMSTGCPAPSCDWPAFCNSLTLITQFPYVGTVISDNKRTVNFADRMTRAILR